MAEIKTEELVNTLGNVHSGNFNKFVKNNPNMINASNDFYSYIRDMLKEHKISQKDVFVKADISEGYGYKLLSGEKTTKQRDVLLRIFFAAGMELSEVQRALHKYGLPELYAKVPRDAFLMILFNEHRNSIRQINELLTENGFEELKTIGL